MFALPSGWSTVQGDWSFTHGAAGPPYNNQCCDTIRTGLASSNGGGTHTSTIIRSPEFGLCDSLTWTYTGGLKMADCCGATDIFPQYSDLELGTVVSSFGDAKGYVGVALRNAHTDQLFHTYTTGNQKQGSFHSPGYDPAVITYSLSGLAAGRYTFEIIDTSGAYTLLVHSVTGSNCVPPA